MNMSVADLLRDTPVLQTVAARWRGVRGNAPAVTRFAPSPTGELHLGHVAHALWVWGVAGQLNGRVIVRMEDHDRTRSRRDYEATILRDIAWLGFDIDAESLQSLQSPHPSTFRQSDVPELYEAAVDHLARTSGVYGCTCTRGALGTPGPDGERCYPGTCRGMPRARPGRTVLRAMVPDGTIVTDDLSRGTLRHHPAQECGDVVVRDADGQWTYQLCVVVDDLRHGVNLVIRGDDLLPSTGRQAMLASLLGRAVPVVTLHHPLILAADGRKLSKRDKSETVAAMRARGMGVADILEAALAVSGLDGECQ